jgi:hypothetical protein
MKLLIMQSPPVPSYLIHLRPKDFCNLVRTGRKLNSKRTKGLYMPTYIFLDCIP